MNGYTLGIDTGGTKTLAAVADQTGRILAVGTGGPGNPDGVGMEKAQAGYDQAIGSALAAAGGVTPDAVFVGSGGVVTEDGRNLVRRLLRPSLGSAALAAQVDHDCRVALAGGLAGRPGIVLIAGTGTSCFGRVGQGREWLASGWGSLFGDEGSSHWIALEGVRAVLWAEDGRGPRTTLRETLIPALGINHPLQILDGTGDGRWDRTAIAALAPLVVAAAEADDAVASGLVDQAGQHLAAAIGAVARALELGSDAEGFEVALVGGLLRATPVRAALTAGVAREFPQARLVQPQLAPVAGAVLLALAALWGTEPDRLPADVIGQLETSSRTFGLHP
ncbi:MAG: hypothetical protein LBR27_06235 [Bifidobacteriaceae bacterium]|jgi:N-acetylglucosamine kinase-like BadF-type ATPase|nr:hypothetical protein [Bifidobacteriaceae bacterium]